MALVNNTLAQYYNKIAMLKRYHSFSIIEIEQLYSYELSIYIQLINEIVQAEKAEQEEKQRQNQY